MSNIDKLIINSPFNEPNKYWSYDATTKDFKLKEGRRPAGYWRQTQSQMKANSDDPGQFIEFKTANLIRSRVRSWKQDNYSNITTTTRKLLNFWNSSESRKNSFFWCQLEALETAIWLVEAPDSEKVNIEIKKDQNLNRECFKLATGTGKTVVMAMLIAWQALNKIANPKDIRFSKNFLIITPGLTVRDRLDVLLPSVEDNYYKQFSIIPDEEIYKLEEANIKISNWHNLYEAKETKGVVKKGPETDEVFLKRIFPEIKSNNNLIVLNDEAHHCHRVAVKKEKEEDKSTIWVKGIDKFQRATKLINVYDFTATPYAKGRDDEDYVFEWIISDFGLNDAIESGLVKTPTVAVRDDMTEKDQDSKSKLFHIYPHVKEDLNKKKEPHDSLPDLVRTAFNLLAGDWVKEKLEWEKSNLEIPPVIISVCNRIETAKRLEYSILNGYFAVDELSNKKNLLRIDSDVLQKLENEEDTSIKLSQKELALKQREIFNTVGKNNKPGAKIKTVIGVDMLSEGWDAKNVSHILGLRAFTSQLLCEQVIGRGLRRISYDIDPETNLFEPEYVVVFGVPFSFLPIENKSGKIKKPEKQKTRISSLKDRNDLEIRWPNILRIDYEIKYYLDINFEKIDELMLSVDDAPTLVEIAPIIEGKPNYNLITEMDLSKLADENRLQKILLQSSVRMHEKFKDIWKGDPSAHISQGVRILEKFIDSEKLKIQVPKSKNEKILKNLVIALNAQKIVNHISHHILVTQNTKRKVVFDPINSLKSSKNMREWYTSKKCEPTKKSQISHIIFDSSWETVGLELERERAGIISYFKNDRVGFNIDYVYLGENKNYFPDFIIKKSKDLYFIVEIKGKERASDKFKWQAAKEWVEAVNETKKFGHWEFHVIKDQKEFFEILK